MDHSVTLEAMDAAKTKVNVRLKTAEVSRLPKYATDVGSGAGRRHYRNVLCSYPHIQQHLKSNGLTLHSLATQDRCHYCKPVLLKVQSNYLPPVVIKYVYIQVKDRTRANSDSPDPTIWKIVPDDSGNCQWYYCDVGNLFGASAHIQRFIYQLTGTENCSVGPRLETFFETMLPKGTIKTQIGRAHV